MFYGKKIVVCDSMGSLLWNYGTVRAFGGRGVAKKDAFFAYNEAHACVLLVGRACLRVVCACVRSENLTGLCLLL